MEALGLKPFHYVKASPAVAMLRVWRAMLRELAEKQPLLKMEKLFLEKF